jgi:hypothetical protein
MKCHKCGKDLCKECSIDYHGKPICDECGLPLLSAFGPLLFNNPDLLEPKKKISDYLDTEK